ncbi:MAG: response regulator [Candidatus Margulisiibacteriota bacterium]|nr:MAG: histidine kinase [Candidatus Margulisbacteria bacterium GWD2_39_127]PZM79748.1 MAG: response regulator [Candidatus Margulisiibacteriota bacterium]HAR62143.1 response regulator [Candidatus Margulisiibacteriota bacterium]HCT85134.1 response regulator [Candidatus Margulisiibacteriota bacterium]HCY36700.1 response regulator [Candidatus Margulisiibacteriota bacterium]
MKKILIVDDSATARSFIKRCLEIVGLRGCDFLEAENGLQALELMNKNLIDLVFTDYFMPQMTGEELLKKIKADPGKSNIKVFIISSAGSVTKEKELLSIGAKAVINKPISPASIAPFIRGIIIE